MGGFSSGVSSKAGHLLPAALEGKIPLSRVSESCVYRSIDHKASVTFHGKAWAGAFAAYDKKQTFLSAWFLT